MKHLKAVSTYDVKTDQVTATIEVPCLNLSKLQVQDAIDQAVLALAKRLVAAGHKSTAGPEILRGTRKDHA